MKAIFGQLPNFSDSSQPSHVAPLNLREFMALYEFYFDLI